MLAYGYMRDQETVIPRSRRQRFGVTSMKSAVRVGADSRSISARRIAEMCR